MEKGGGGGGGGGGGNARINSACSNEKGSEHKKYTLKLPGKSEERSARPREKAASHLVVAMETEYLDKVGLFPPLSLSSCFKQISKAVNGPLLFF